ncbi:NADH-quinone oxidoreductase subunit L [Nostocoides veronense]|uniref:NADH:quinone oxidoreductase/Mrp antiporter transmembrane domain-containing protein n=1 Tax=Nostocoides veronense TaxID=330836 RepID=A0ABN2LAD5_9MICO
MTAPHLLALALLVLAAGAPAVLAAGLASRRVASGLAQVVALAAAGLGVAALWGAHGAYALPVLRTSDPRLSDELTLFPARIATGPVVVTIAATVLLVVLAVQVFAGWYLHDDDRQPAFAATVSLFAAAMLLLVVSRDLILTLIGWEVMGWCSYLLIGHWSRKGSARRAAYKAFLVTRLADAAFVIGIVALIALAGSSDLEQVLGASSDLSRVTSSVAGACPDTGSCLGPNTALINLAMTALVIGVLGKSAQIPFQDWLIDAMEGPTPASALIHAATMVAAGTWVLTALHPVLFEAPVALWVLAVATAATMIYAAFTAFFQTDVKRILAWSTISQVAVMLSPLAVAATVDDGSAAAAGHLFSHAIFKALLFLTVGWLAVLAGSTAARDLDGIGADSTFAKAVWGLGLISLAGVPLTVGGISKEHVIDVAAWIGGDGPGLRQGIVTVALLVTVAMTAAYATRAYEIVAGRRAGSAARPSAPQAPGHRDAGPLVKLTLAALAAATLAGGLVFLLGPLDPGHVSVGLLALSVLLIGTGVVVGWYLRPDDSRPPARLMTLASNGFGAAYLKVVAVPVLALARLAAFVDREVVETYVRAPGWVASLTGRGADWSHAKERVSTDLVWVVLGLLAVAGVALWG